ncbi:MAG TPA: hypothetical protein VKU44_08495, partial [Terriglobia bacterium]|nr:hypothetical protein [Terriglobia bacterium]
MKVAHDSTWTHTAQGVVALLLVCAGPRLLVATGLRAGAAKSTITPDIRAGKVYMAGFGNNRVATGVHDDLYVRCLALGAGHTTLVMCGVD